MEHRLGSLSYALARSGPQAMTFACVGSNRPPITSVPVSIPASTRMPYQPRGQRRRLDASGCGQEPVLGVLPRTAGLPPHDPSGAAHALEPERLAGGDAELIRERTRRSRVGDRMSTCRRVFISRKAEPPGLDQELAGPCADVADRAGDAMAARPADARTGSDRWRRRLLEDLLMASLDRAVAFAEVDTVAGRVEQDPDLEATGAFDEPLGDQLFVTEAAIASRRAEARASGSRPGCEPCASPCRHRRLPA